ncbi:carbohydrate kinase family protein [Patescibacteria group bacterium]|nr:carbohydrate kinase family protein [Patescibacteria group bacterium]
MKKKILVTGSLAHDYIMNFPDSFKNHIMPEKIHILSVSFVADTLNKQQGGTAGNIAYTLKLLGEEPLIFSTVGNDFDQYESWLKKKKIDTTHIKHYEKELTASCHIVTDKDDNQISAFHGGAMFKNDISLKPILDTEDIGMAIVSPNGKDGMLRYVYELSETTIPFIFDPGQNIPLFSKDELKECIARSTMLIVNDYELALIEKGSGYTLETLKNMLEYVIVTLGKKGSIIHDKNNSIRIPPAKPENTSDPTGAGDAFRAGLIKGLINNTGLETAGKIGSVSSVYTVEKYGTQTHAFTMKEFNKRFKDNFGKQLKIS